MYICNMLVQNFPIFGQFAKFSVILKNLLKFYVHLEMGGGSTPCSRFSTNSAGRDSDGLWPLLTAPTWTTGGLTDWGICNLQCQIRLGRGGSMGRYEAVYCFFLVWDYYLSVICFLHPLLDILTIGSIHYYIFFCNPQKTAKNLIADNEILTIGSIHYYIDLIRAYNLGFYGYGYCAPDLANVCQKAYPRHTPRLGW